MPGVLSLVERLAGDLPAAGDGDSPDEAERRLLSHLLLYHHREGKPTWWRYFDLRGKPLPDLLEDRDAIAGLTPDPEWQPQPHKRSLDYRFTFPPQEFRLGTGDADDPTTGECFQVVAVDEESVVLRRGRTKPPPAPVALVDGTIIPVGVLRDALMTLSHSLLEADGRFAVSRALLRREPPRLASRALGEDVATLREATLGLDQTILPVQGPPGTGKTYRGARMIVAALAAGRRVGVTAQSHAEVQNLIGEVERAAYEEGLAFSGAYKGASYQSPHGMIEEVEENSGVTAGHRLVAGTAWLFARDEHHEKFDLLFIDEAGQFALADAVAVSLAANNLVLLGDPQQLPQVTQADHPAGSGNSVLEHLLADAKTIVPPKGVLLTESWRMHPAVCSFVSEHSYDSRLHSRTECSDRRVDGAGRLVGTGLRTVAVGHDGRSQSSPEEAAVIAELASELLDGTSVTDDRGAVRPLDPSDILIVARTTLPSGASASECPPASESAPSTASRGRKPQSSSMR